MNPEKELIDKANQIEELVMEMSVILQQYYPKQYSIAYQHWIPQILTGLYHYDKWLDRGVYSFQNTISSIQDHKNTKGSLNKIF